MTAGNTIGVDPHRETFTATVLDERGGEGDHAPFANTRAGHADAERWGAGHGPIERWGVEGASGLGRHLAEFLVARDFDVRDVPPHKTSIRQRGRHEGKTDRLDSHRVAAETQTNPRLARACKHSTPAAPDPTRDRISLWHNGRKSLTKIRVQLLGELDALVHDLPEELRSQLTAMKKVRACVNSLSALDTAEVTDPTVLLRLQLIDHRVVMLRDVLEQDRIAADELCPWPRSSPPPNPPSPISSASRREPQQRYSSRPATSDASPRPASPASTAPHRSPQPQAKATANPSVIASHAAATGASTRSSTASR